VLLVDGVQEGELEDVHHLVVDHMAELGVRPREREDHPPLQVFREALHALGD
jgi:hypothetical protein